MKWASFILFSFYYSFGYAQVESSTSYNLFHKVPKELMRKDMETDRPDVTESPYTVEAGHVQFESDIFRYKSASTPTVRNYQYLFAPFTIKLGLTSHTDFQIGLESYRREYHESNTKQEEHYGNYGSILFRLKYNLAGNDSGRFAIAVMPYAKMPTHSFFDHHKLEGGIIVPAQFAVAKKLSLSFQEELDVVAADEEYELQGLQSLSVSIDLLDNLKAMGETYYVYHFGTHDIENYLNVALQYSPVDNFAVDGGMIQGFQSGAEHHYYLGVAWRW